MRSWCLSVVLLVLPACEGCEGGGALIADGARYGNNQWSDVPLLVAPRAAHSTVASDASILVIGGEAFEASTRIERCDLSASQCEVIGELQAEHRFADVVLLSNGHLLVAPGTNVNETPFEIFDPVEGRSVPTGASRGDAKLVTLEDDRVLAIFATGTEIFQPTTSAWGGGPTLREPRYGAQATRLLDGRVLVTGGACPSCARPEIIDVTAGTSELGPPMQAAREFHTATLLLDGRVLVVGGTWAGANDEVGAELYDPMQNSWSVAAGLEQNRLNHAAIRLGDGRVLVTGGHVGTDLAQEPTYSIYAPDTQQWETGSDGLPWRTYHSMAALPDGSAVVVGGDTGYLDGVGSAPR